MKSYAVKRCLILLLLMVFVFASIMPVFAESSLRVAKIAKLSGTVTVMKSGGEKSFPAFKNMGLLQGDKLITGADGAVTLELDSDKEVVIAKNTQLVLSELIAALKGKSGSTSLNLLGGNVMVNIKSKLDGDSKFEIKTPTAVMGVRGTRFFVGYNGGVTEVAVFEGNVRVGSYRLEEQPDGTVRQTPTELSLSENQLAAFDAGTMQEGQPELQEVTAEELPLFVLETIQADPQNISTEILENIEEIIEQKRIEEQLAPPPPPLPPQMLLFPPLIMPPPPPPPPPPPLPPPPGRNGNDDGQALIRVSSITLNREELILNSLNITEELIATITPSNAANKAITWTSSNPSVATVVDGVVTGLTEGTSLITVATVDGSYTATCAVTVEKAPVSVTGITLNHTSAAVDVNGSVTLTATVQPEDATNKAITWTSSIPSVATVVDGVVTGLTEGTAIITVTTVDGSYTATCDVSVAMEEPPVIPVNSISLAPGELEFNELGQDVTLTATVEPSNATQYTITWSSSDEEVATVDSNGKVTAVGWGFADIYARTSNPSVDATCVVTVARNAEIISATINNIYMSGSHETYNVDAELALGGWCFGSLTEGDSFVNEDPQTVLLLMLQTDLEGVMDKTLSVEFEKSVDGGETYTTIGSMEDIYIDSVGMALLDLPIEGLVGEAGNTVIYRLKNLYVDTAPAFIAKNRIFYTVEAPPPTKTMTPSVIGAVGAGDTQICGTGEPGSYIQILRDGVLCGEGTVDPYNGYFNIDLDTWPDLAEGETLELYADAEDKPGSDVAEVTVQSELAAGLDNGTGLWMTGGVTLYPGYYTQAARLYTSFIPNSVEETSLGLSAYSGCSIVSVRKNGVDFTDYNSEFELPVGLTEIEIEIAQSGFTNKTIVIVISRSGNTAGTVPVIQYAKTLDKHNMEIVFDQDIAILGSAESFMSKLTIDDFSYTPSHGRASAESNTLHINITGYEGELSLAPDLSGPILSIAPGAFRSVSTNHPNGLYENVIITDGISPKLLDAAFIEPDRFILYFNEMVEYVVNDSDEYNYINNISSNTLQELGIHIVSASHDGYVYVELSSPVPTADFELEDLNIEDGAFEDMNGNEFSGVSGRSVDNYIPPQHVEFTSYVDVYANTVTLEVYFDHEIYLDTNSDNFINIYNVSNLDTPVGEPIGVWDEISYNNGIVTIDLKEHGTPLVNGETYCVTIPDDMFYSAYDQNGEKVYYPGIIDKETWVFYTYIPYH